MNLGLKVLIEHLPIKSDPAVAAVAKKMDTGDSAYSTLRDYGEIATGDCMLHLQAWRHRVPRISQSPLRHCLKWITTYRNAAFIPF